MNRSNLVPQTHQLEYKMRVHAIIFCLIAFEPSFTAEFSASKVQLLAGSGFDDRIRGVNTRSGVLTIFSAERLDRFGA